MKNSGLSRRDFVKFSAIGATALGMGATNLMASAMNEKDVKWDEEYDVVIIGSGFAALAAGVTSAKKGNKVVLIEKMGRTGGNSVINGGIFAVPNSDMQKKAGIKDSTELFIKNCLKAGRGINHVDLLAKIGERERKMHTSSHLIVVQNISIRSLTQVVTQCQEAFKQKSAAALASCSL